MRLRNRSKLVEGSLFAIIDLLLGAKNITLYFVFLPGFIGSIPFGNLFFHVTLLYHHQNPTLAKLTALQANFKKKKLTKKPRFVSARASFLKFVKYLRPRRVEKNLGSLFLK